MSSSKILPGCLVSLAAVVVFFFSWVALPSVRSEQEVKKLLARQQQAFEEDQKLARDPERNAFIDPQLAPFWGRKSVESKSQSNAAEAVSGLLVFGFLGRPGDQDARLASLWKGKDAGLRKAVADFEAFLPVLRKTIERPCFILPTAQPPDFASELSNFVAQRSIAHALSAYAEVKLADGKPAAALDASLDILAFSRLLVGQKAHPLISAMVASAVQATGQVTLSYVLQSAPLLKEAELRKALEVLKSSAVDRELGLQAMEYELWVAQNSFQKSPETGILKGPLMRAPGVWRREWRLFQNDYYPFVEAARTRQPFNTNWVNQLSLLNWFLGQHSLTSQSLLPNFERVMNLLEISRQRQDFLHLYVELLLQKRLGRLAKELSPQWLGKLDPNHLTYRVEKGEPHLEYDLDSGLAKALPRASAPGRGSARWENLMRPHWAIPVAP